MLTTIKCLWQIAIYGRNVLPYISLALRYLGDEQLKYLLEEIIAAIMNFISRKTNGEPIPPKDENVRRELRKRALRRIVANDLGFREYEDLRLMVSYARANIKKENEEETA